jgi:hypothetical protein
MAYKSCNAGSLPGCLVLLCCVHRSPNHFLQIAEVIRVDCQLIPCYCPWSLAGIGGNGGALGFPPLAGSGGGGGGGWSVAPGTITDIFIAGGGGGVGLLGFNGNSGAAGTADNRGGKAGSFGTDGALPAGGNLGGGAGGAIRGTVVSFAGGNGGYLTLPAVSLIPQSPPQDGVLSFFAAVANPGAPAAE